LPLGTIELEFEKSPNDDNIEGTNTFPILLDLNRISNNDRTFEDNIIQQY
jgi:hypothetical protein